MCASLVARKRTQWIPTVGRHAGTVIQKRPIYTSIGLHTLEYIHIYIYINRYTYICILCIYGFQSLANGQVPVFGIWANTSQVLAKVLPLLGHANPCFQHSAAHSIHWQYGANSWKTLQASCFRLARFWNGDGTCATTFKPHTVCFTRCWKPIPPWLDHKHIGSQVLEHVNGMVSSLWKQIFDSTGFHMLEDVRLYAHVHV